MLGEDPGFSCKAESHLRASLVIAIHGTEQPNNIVNAMNEVLSSLNSSKLIKLCYYLSVLTRLLIVFSWFLI